MVSSFSVTIKFIQLHTNIFYIMPDVSRKASIAQDVSPLWVGVIPLMGRKRAKNSLDSRDAQWLIYMRSDETKTPRINNHEL
ncbi:hypothetical protein BFU36_07810 [Sulfolobus sp. A20]|nr:hypothetical protein BFU36_07810 [Sulfolobus sp. A20]